MTAKQISHANEIMEDLKSRLITLATNRPFRFLETRKADADSYLAAMCSFEGLTEEEISNLETINSVKFPLVFRCYLQNFGKSHGTLFRGSDFSPEEFAGYRKWAEELLGEKGKESFLTQNAFVFLVHQGYTFLFFYSEASFDLPIYQFVEGDDEPKIISKSFAKFLDSTLEEMEKVNQAQRASGGYYLTVSADGQEKATHPAKNSDVRPLDEEDIFIKIRKWNILRWLKRSDKSI